LGKTPSGSWKSRGKRKIRAAPGGKISRPKRSAAVKRPSQLIVCSSRLDRERKEEASERGRRKTTPTEGGEIKKLLQRVSGRIKPKLDDH